MIINLLTNAHTHTHTHARTHARTHSRLVARSLVVKNVFLRAGHIVLAREEFRELLFGGCLLHGGIFHTTGRHGCRGFDCPVSPGVTVEVSNVVNPVSLGMRRNRLARVPVHRRIESREEERKTRVVSHGRLNENGERKKERD